MENTVTNSARSGRKRTQVGSTNRSSVSSPTGSARADASQETQGRRQRPVTSTAVWSRRSNLARENLTTSRSMPSLGTSSSPRFAHDLDLASGRNRNEEKSNRKSSGGIVCTRSPDFAMTVDDTQTETEKSGASDPYMTSTQKAYTSGLQPAPSTVPDMDPYRHCQLLHDRWICRARHRLGDIATLKYGSIREFFRSYDSNCDGFLDFDEFSKGITMSQLDHLFPRSLQRTLFDKIDRDKSGTIELHEFATFLGRSEPKGTPSGELSVWRKQDDKQRQANDAEARSVTLQPIHDHKTQRIKNKLSHCLNKFVPGSCAGLTDNRAMFLRKQFAFLNEEVASRGIKIKDLVFALGPRGMNLGVSHEELRLLVKEMNTNGDGNVTLKEFAAFINLDDHDPLYQPLFDGRRRNVNILQSMIEEPPPAESPEEAFFRARADELHSAAVPSKVLDREVRLERDRIAQELKAKLSRGRFTRPESPAWTVDRDSVTVSTPSGRKVVDIWDLPPPTRHLSSVKRSLTSSMRYLPCTSAAGGSEDDPSTSCASDGGAFAEACPQEQAQAQEQDSLSLSLSNKKKSLASLSSGQDLFSSLEKGRLQVATAGALARTRKVAKQTWADIGHGGMGNDAGTDETSSFYYSPSERFTTTNSERYAPLIKMKKFEKGQRSAGFDRQRPGDAATEASLRRQKSEVRSSKVRAHMERVALSIKTEEVAARLKEERRIRGKARTRLRYNQWVNSIDNWLSDEAPTLSDYDKRQFPEQNIRLRGGQQVHEALGGPMAIPV